MDEPFGAVDPITRQRLQDELLRLQEELRKTIVFVTHDFDEAVKLGDKIAILRAGAEIVQYDTPEQILTNPADDFVRDFVGSGALKQLTLTRVRDVELHEAAVARVGGDPGEAIQAARSIAREHVIVLDDQDRSQRWMSLDELQDPGSLRRVPRDEQLESVNLASTLNDALDSMLTSSHGVVVVTGRRNAYQGVIRGRDDHGRDVRHPRRTRFRGDCFMTFIAPEIDGRGPDPGPRPRVPPTWPGPLADSSRSSASWPWSVPSSTSTSRMCRSRSSGRSGSRSCSRCCASI